MATGAAYILYLLDWSNELRMNSTDKISRLDFASNTEQKNN